VLICVLTAEGLIRMSHRETFWLPSLYDDVRIWTGERVAVHALGLRGDPATVLEHQSRNGTYKVRVQLDVTARTAWVLPKSLRAPYDPRILPLGVTEAARCSWEQAWFGNNTVHVYFDHPLDCREPSIVSTGRTLSYKAECSQGRSIGLILALAGLVEPPDTYDECHPQARGPIRSWQACKIVSLATNSTWDALVYDPSMYEVGANKSIISRMQWTPVAEAGFLSIRRILPTTVHGSMCLLCLLLFCAVWTYAADLGHLLPESERTQQARRMEAEMEAVEAAEETRRRAERRAEDARATARDQRRAEGDFASRYSAEVDVTHPIFQRVVRAVRAMPTENWRPSAELRLADLKSCLQRRQLLTAGMLEISEYRRALEEHGYSQCSVCLEDCRPGDLMRLLSRCGHSFHDSCIEEWFFTPQAQALTCPLCRTPILND
tara:strand:- start:251 stop:1555 length:1305 start_codon:yes stop_codon:yes gene_type:complete